MSRVETSVRCGPVREPGRSGLPEARRTATGAGCKPGTAVTSDVFVL
jgi:hypothetical protein